MEILHALRGLGMSGPRTSKGLELDGNRGEVIQPMDKSKKPPRAPNGNKRIKFRRNGQLWMLESRLLPGR